MRPRPTTEQLAAIGSPTRRTFVEAGPGTGKTTMAAYRFGLLRFRSHFNESKGVVGLSFTRSATWELRKQVTALWGGGVLSGQSRVTTIDSELVGMLRLLLRLGKVNWPGGLVEIEPLDSCDSHPSWKYNAGKYQTYVADLVNGQIVAKTGGAPTYRINKGDLETLLAEGICSHEDVRRIIGRALSNNDLRSALRDRCRDSVDHLIVDEMFDADDLDIDVIRLHCEADVPVTVFGDRWQALYEFRDANPQAASDALSANDLDFSLHSVQQSHRFQTDELRSAATTLRGQSFQVPPANQLVDVAIARWWKTLWQGPVRVLPASFGGRIQNQTEALQALLLDHALNLAFSASAATRADALLLLKLDPWTDTRWPEVLGPVLSSLVDETTQTASQALAALRNLAPTFGTAGAAPSLQGASETGAIERMRALASRRLCASKRIPGVTAHQAKGRQWGHVGVLLLQSDHDALQQGLDRDQADHRALYVALTRGIHSTGVL